MVSNQKRELDTVEAERQRLIEEVRKAERDWNLAQWRFHNALGDDHVDYAIYGLEAAEKKLDMLLRQAKWLWGHSIPEKATEKVTGKVTKKESREMG